MQAFKHINAADSKTLIEAGKPQIIDIRDANSYQAGHIIQAQRIDNNNVADFIARSDKDTPLIICCYHGNSSQGAAQYFAEQGFKEVYSLDGGYEMWKVTHPDLCER